MENLNEKFVVYRGIRGGYSGNSQISDISSAVEVLEGGAEKWIVCPYCGVEITIQKGGKRYILGDNARCESCCRCMKIVDPNDLIQMDVVYGPVGSVGGKRMRNTKTDLNPNPIRRCQE